MYWNSPRTWSPFDELQSLQRDMNRLFGGYAAGTPMSRFPALNVWGNEENVVVTAELPGLDIQDIDMSIVNNQLTIKGEREAERPDKDATCHRSERGVGTFTRSVRLPFAVEDDQAVARYEDGVLTITLPRLERTKPKRIEIKTA